MPNFESLQSSITVTVLCKFSCDTVCVCVHMFYMLISCLMNRIPTFHSAGFTSCVTVMQKDVLGTQLAISLWHSGIFTSHMS